jgi:hypothetical protein
MGKYNSLKIYREDSFQCNPVIQSDEGYGEDTYEFWEEDKNKSDDIWKQERTQSHIKKQKIDNGILPKDYKLPDLITQQWIDNIVKKSK